MRFGRLDALVKTLRFRLAFWNTGVLVVLSLATLMGLREGLRLTLLHELDQQLAEDAQEVNLVLAEHADDPPRLQEVIDRKAQSHVPHGWFVQIYDGEGRLRWASSGTPDL